MPRLKGTDVRWNGGQSRGSRKRQLVVQRPDQVPVLNVSRAFIPFDVVCAFMERLDRAEDVGALLVACCSDGRNRDEVWASVLRWVRKKATPSWAVSTGRIEFVKAALCDVRQGSVLLGDALTMACRLGGRHMEVVRLLMDRKPILLDVETALCSAAAHGRYDVVCHLIHESKIGTEAGLNGVASLRWAAMNGHADVVELLLSPAGGCDASAHGSEGLRLAAVKGHVEVVSLLLDAGADVHDDDDEALRLASGAGHSRVVRRLVQGGATVSSQNGAPLIVATRGGHEEVMRYLLEAGANPDAMHGEPVCCVAGTGSITAMTLLLDSGADVNARDGLPLRHAAGKGRVDMVEFLLSRGADLHARNDKALRWACMSGHVEVVEVLIRAGADMRLDGHGALHWACYNGHDAVVSALLQLGVSDEAHLDRALHWAASNGRCAVIEMIVDAQIRLTTSSMSETVWSGVPGGVSVSSEALRRVDYAIRVSILHGCIEVVDLLSAKLSLVLGSCLPTRS